MNTKYIKYAIGEIVLVVIGILIALSINNWNEKSKEKALAQTYLDRIEQDFERLMTRSNSLGTQNREILKSITETQNLLERGSKLSSSEVLVVDYAMLWFSRSTYQLPDLVTYEEMKESGNLNLIYDVELREQLAEFYAYLKQVENIYDKLGDDIEDQFSIYNRHIRSKTDPITLDITFNYDFDAMTNDVEFINTFSRMAMHWRAFVFFVEAINIRGGRISQKYFSSK